MVTMAGGVRGDVEKEERSCTNYKTLAPVKGQVSQKAVENSSLSGFSGLHLVFPNPPR